MATTTTTMMLTTTTTTTSARRTPKAKTGKPAAKKMVMSAAAPEATVVAVLPAMSVAAPGDSDDEDDSSDDGFAPMAPRARVGTAAARYSKGGSSSVSASSSNERLAPPPAYQASLEYGGLAGSPSNMSEEDLLEARRQFHLACEQTRRKTIKDGLEELKGHIPTCENQKMTKATILAKAISYLQDSKRQRELMAHELNRLRSDAFDARSSCTCGAAAHLNVETAAPAPVPAPAPLHQRSQGRNATSHATVPAAARTVIADESTRALPEGWEVIITPEGRPLYRDVSTNLTQWVHPTLNPPAPHGRRATTAAAASTGSAKASGKRAATLSAPNPGPAVVPADVAAATAPSAQPPLPAPLDVKIAGLVSEAAIVPAVLSPLDSAAMAIGDVMLAGDVWPALPTDDTAYNIFTDPHLSLYPPVKREHDEGYHSRETSYNGTEVDAYMDSSMVLA